MTTLSLTEGRTEPIDAILYADGAPIDLSGMAVVLTLHNRNGAAISGSPFAVTPDGNQTANRGKVKFSLAANDLKNSDSPLQARFRVTTAAGKVFHVPEGRSDLWTISLE